MSESIKGFFYPELCEKQFDDLRMHKGKLSLEGAIPISVGKENAVFQGAFGDAYCVPWFKPGTTPAVFQRDSDDEDILNEYCCLKVLKNNYKDDKERYDRHCYIEYDLLRKANGASGRVPRPFAFGTVCKLTGDKEEVLWAICMEFLPTGDGTRYFLSAQSDIKKLIENNRCHAFAAGECLPIELASLAYQMCLALIDLHKRGVSHRDLQPRNVAVSFDAKGDVNRNVNRVFLIDLGNSAFVDDDATPVNLNAGRFAAKHFGAPEMFAFEDVNDGDGPHRAKFDFYDLRNRTTVDIWSFGAIIYYYYTGNYPDVLNEAGQSHYEIYISRRKNGLCLIDSSNVKSEALEDPEDALVELDLIVRGCTRYNPEERLPLSDIQVRLEKILGIDKQSNMRNRFEYIDILQESPTMTVRFGGWALRILQSYTRVKNNFFHHEYTRHSKGITYTIMVSCDRDVQADEWDYYTSEILKRIKKLYGENAVVKERVYTVKASDMKSDKYICLLELKEQLYNGYLYLSKHYLCFISDMVIRVGVLCQTSNDEELLSEARISINRELTDAVRSLTRA